MASTAHLHFDDEEGVGSEDHKFCCSCRLKISFLKAKRKQIVKIGMVNKMFSSLLKGSLQ